MKATKKERVNQVQVGFPFNGGISHFFNVFNNYKPNKSWWGIISKCLTSMFGYFDNSGLVCQLSLITIISLNIAAPNKQPPEPTASTLSSPSEEYHLGRRWCGDYRGGRESHTRTPLTKTESGLTWKRCRCSSC